MSAQPATPVPGEAEKELEAARAEVTQLTERCAQLRQMNEELLAMLERMYTGGGEQQPK